MLTLVIACAIASSNANFTCPPGMIIIGEVGLAGEVRSVSQLTERLSEAEKLGFEKAIIPKSNMKSLSYKGKLQIQPAESVSDAVNMLR